MSKSTKAPVCDDMYPGRASPRAVRSTTQGKLDSCSKSDGSESPVKHLRRSIASSSSAAACSDAISGGGVAEPPTPSCSIWSHLVPMSAALLMCRRSSSMTTDAISVWPTLLGCRPSVRWVKNCVSELLQNDEFRSITSHRAAL